MAAGWSWPTSSGVTAPRREESRRSPDGGLGPPAPTVALRHQTRRSWHPWWLALVGLITVVGLLLRLPSLDDSLFGDEASTYFIVTGRDLTQVLDWVRSDLEVTPPLFFVLTWMTDTFGESVESLRVVSLVAGVAAIPLTYVLGVWTVGQRAALFGAALVAISPFLIFYSAEARSYALVLLLDLLSSLCLLRALDGRRTGWFVAYAACSCAAVYAHYTAVFVLAAQFAWAFVTHPQARRALLAANMAAAIAFLPWLPGFLEDRQGPNVIEILAPFELRTVSRELLHWSIGHPVMPLDSLPTVGTGSLVGAGLLVGVLGLAIRRGRHPIRRPSAGTALVLILAFAAPVGVVLYSILGPSLFITRNLITSWPGLALSAGLLVTRAGRLAGTIAAGLILLAFALGAGKMLDRSYQRPDYEAAADFIERLGRPGDPVVDAPLFINPLSSLEVALGAGRSPSEVHPVLRLGYPQRATSIASLKTGASPLAVLPQESPQEVARKASSLAPSGTIFIVTWGATAAELRPFGGVVAEFLDSLPRYRLALTRTFPGFPFREGSYTVSVSALRRKAPPMGSRATGRVS